MYLFCQPTLLQPFFSSKIKESNRNPCQPTNTDDSRSRKRRTLKPKRCMGFPVVEMGWTADFPRIQDMAYLYLLLHRYSRYRHMCTYKLHP